jgi:hypothetical protein
MSIFCPASRWVNSNSDSSFGSSFFYRSGVCCLSDGKSLWPLRFNERVYEWDSGIEDYIDFEV